MICPQCNGNKIGCKICNKTGCIDNPIIMPTLYCSPDSFITIECDHPNGIRLVKLWYTCLGRQMFHLMWQCFSCGQTSTKYVKRELLWESSIIEAGEMYRDKKDFWMNELNEWRDRLYTQGRDLFVFNKKELINRVKNYLGIPDTINFIFPDCNYKHGSVYVYVLRLYMDKYYVGSSSDPQTRFLSHVLGSGTFWTLLYPPLECVELVEFPNREMAESNEEEITGKYCDMFGYNNVRGGNHIIVSNEYLNKLMSNGV